MNKKVIGISLIAVLVLAFGFATVASADGPTPFNFGKGRQGQVGGMEDNPVHDLVIAEYADAFGISAEELEARLVDGERLNEIAAEYGYEGEEFTALVEEVHAAATEAAVSQGLITQEQADLFADRPKLGGPGQNSKMGGPPGQGDFEEGPLHDYMSAAIADAFGITVEELEAAHEAGTPLHELVDMDIEEVQEIMQAAKDSAIEQALADGVITEEELGKFGNNGGFCGPGGRGGEGFPPRNNGANGPRP
ncbi:MAG: hypothetical protein HON98_00095 [Chloroflexi bacterium]|jgi:hypothetical protein|nr:hypothetical protein [Chloroflexota bacterium]MBT4305784.1 hypothetical protein [Chloroflexota bacterium]MBT4533608.1 hypothetical protein [Chloroflexota bacterium]MBT4681749.1 hypothetical protein [Chloroflexota bacterium]MBT4754071.1 hypothetical protein [Chloroflexota bacterium]